MRGHSGPSLEYRTETSARLRRSVGTFSNQGNETQGKTLFGCLSVKHCLCSVRCLRLHSAQRVDWMSVEAAVPAALGELRAARVATQCCFGARRGRTHE